MIFFFLPVIGAFIGWITNLVAIRLLFRPLEPLKLGPLPVTFQGLIPKRREQIAAAVAQVVADKLFSVSELAARMDLPALQKETERDVRRVVEEWCQGKLALLPEALRQYCSNFLRNTIAGEVSARFPALAGNLLARMQAQIDIRQVVTEKINRFSFFEVENIVLTVARRELKQIEWLGAVLGFIVGLLQAVLLWLLR